MRNRIIWNRSGVFAVGLILMLSLVSGNAQARSLKDLGTLGGISSIARAINESGQIVGDSTTKNENTHAFIYTPWVGHMQDIGTLGGRFAIAEALNNRGQVVGASSTVADDVDFTAHAFVWERGKMTALPFLPGDTSGEAAGINDLGQVVGSSGGVPVIWTKGKVKVLIPSALGGFATGISNTGVVVGNMFDAATDFHGFVLRNGVLTNLDSIVGPQTSATAVTDSGNVVGNFLPTNSQRPHAFLYNIYTKRVTDLGVFRLYGLANGVSNGGLVAGEGGDDNAAHAVLWDYNHVVRDLGSLPGTNNFAAAFAVNNAGIAVGFSATGTLNGQHAIAWLP